MLPAVPIFDLDGTLIDSDDALVAPFAALGIPLDRVEFGHPLEDECARLGVTVDDYLAHYDLDAVQPFPGAIDLVGRLGRWAVCSNKHPMAGEAELARLGWSPEVALFAAPGHGAKELGPVLEQLGCAPAQVLFVGDTAHDRQCARAVGCRFLLAGWNPRAVAEHGDTVLSHPMELLDHLR